jgi:hypothetical protein
MSKRAAGASDDADSKSPRLGIGSFEPVTDDSFSRQHVRAAFFLRAEELDRNITLTLYQKSFFEAVRLVWSQFPQTFPSSILELSKDEAFLPELERVIKNHSAGILNPVTDILHPAFALLIARPFINERDFFLNHPRGVLLRELLRPLDDFSEGISKIFRSWSELKKVENSEVLCKTISEWSKHWNLDAAWCRDYAVVALGDWLLDKYIRFDDYYLSLRRPVLETRQKHVWGSLTGTHFSTGEGVKELQAAMAVISNIPRFHFAWRGIDFQTSRWNPIATYRDEWADECEKEFQHYLRDFEDSGNEVPVGTLTRFRARRDKYLRETEKILPPSLMRKTPRRWAEEHITWAVRFQVQKWSLSKIEKTYSARRKTVADGVNRMLEFIGLPRRNDLPAGMPKGTRLQAKRRIVRK